jgi:hypothetical protein
MKSEVQRQSRYGGAMRAVKASRNEYMCQRAGAMS